MASYIITPSKVKVKVNVKSAPADLLKVGFNPAEPAGNDVLVRDAEQALTDQNLQGGRMALMNGPASLPVAAVLTHRLAHLFGVLAVWDPKLAGYVVAISHDPDYRVGDVIPGAEVVETA